MKGRILSAEQPPQLCICVLLSQNFSASFICVNVLPKLQPSRPRSSYVLVMLRLRSPEALSALFSL